MLLEVGAVLGSCCGCMTLVELLAREDPGCMDLMTFSTFLFIAIEGFFVGTKCLSQPRKIPLRKYWKLVIVFFIVSVTNNKALSYNVPVPLHIIFRSGTLLASMLLGRVILNKRYAWHKYAAVGMVSFGILLCTMASSKQLQEQREAKKTTPPPKEHAPLEDEDETWRAESLGSWEAGKLAAGWSSLEILGGELLIGVGLLLTALILAAYLGICQEQLYSAYGKVPRESLFYVHALSLPFFLLLWPSISHHARAFSASPLIEVLPVLPPLPRLWAILLLSDVAQYLCIRCVYTLTAEYSALTVTLVVTLRKFLSLLFSILYFDSPFTPLHWVGTGLVFAGTAVFSDLPLMIKSAVLGKRKEE